MKQLSYKRGNSLTKILGVSHWPVKLVIQKVRANASYRLMYIDVVRKGQVNGIDKGDSVTLKNLRHNLQQAKPKTRFTVHRCLQS